MEFRWFRRAEHRRLIGQGRVACPLRERDADVDLCLPCTWARQVDPQAAPPFVRCRPPRKLLLLP